MRFVPHRIVRNYAGQLVFPQRGPNNYRLFKLPGINYRRSRWKPCQPWLRERAFLQSARGFDAILLQSARGFRVKAPTNCPWTTSVVHRLFYNETARRHRWQTMEKRYSVYMDFDLGALILPVDEPQRLEKYTAEKLKFLVALPELSLERRPRDELRAVVRYPVQPLSQPGVDVQSHRGVREGGQGAFVERSARLAKYSSLCAVRRGFHRRLGWTELSTGGS